MIRVLKVVLASVVAFAVAGCVAIPMSGPVETGLTDLTQSEQLVEFNPSGPLTGSSQENLVRGFVLAATSSTDDYAVAREFLTPEYAQQWDPYANVTIDEGTRPYRESDGSVGMLQVSATATIDSAGTMRPVAPGPSTEMRFEFEQVGDEWRISSAPNGIILDRANFTAIWSAHQLYFVGVDGAYVPETRWFLSRSAMPTEIVSTLLEGPSELYAEQVTNSFPIGATVRQDAVVVIDSTARVELEGLVQPEPAQAQLMLGQVQQTLLSVQGVGRVQLFIDGTEVEKDPDHTETPAETPTKQLVGVQDGQFGVITDGDVQRFIPMGSVIGEMDPAAVMLSSDDTSAVVRATNGVSYVEGEQTVMIDNRTTLLDPSLDHWGWVWTASHETPSQIRVSTPEGEQVELDAPWKNEADVTAIRVAPGGNLIAALAARDNGSVVLVAGIVRDDAGQPVKFGSVMEIEMWATGVPIDLDWIDSLRFVALTGLGGNSSKVTVGGVGLFSSEQGAVTDGAQISGLGGRSLIRVRSSGDAVYAAQGGGWQRVETDVTALATRG